MQVQIYTTKLDKSTVKNNEKEAARIAAEIEGKRATNVHQAEERGQIAYREAASLYSALAVQRCSCETRSRQASSGFAG